MNKQQSGWLRFSFLAVFLALGMVKAACGFEIGITVAPNVLNIQSQGSVVTVHTDIAYYQVDVYSVYLNGVYIQSSKADNQGNFVAKFDMGAIKFLDGLVYGELNTLTLVGNTRGEPGEAFSGSDDVLVVDNQPQGGRR